MAPSWWGRFGCAIALLLAVSQAQAQAQATDPIGIALTYEAPAECPSRGEVESELRARVAPSWLDGADTRRFDARIVRQADGDYAGSLAISQPDQAPKVRVVEAKTCRAAATSIAVFLSIALDPAAREAPAAPLPPAPEPVPPAPPIRAASRKAPAPRVPPPPVWTWGAGVDATYLHMPEGARGSRVHGEIARAREETRLALALRLSWGFSRFSTFPDRAGEAEFLLKTARAEGCARIDLRPVASTFSLDGCGGLDVGTLSGHAQALRAAVAQTVQWVAAIAVLRPTWSILPWLSVSAEASLVVPFERTRFALSDPPRLVYRAPAALFGGGAGIGITARFP